MTKDHQNVPARQEILLLIISNFQENYWSAAKLLLNRMNFFSSGNK
jgi:hypothetical protein